MFTKNVQGARGFTLVEMIVSLGIFAVVATISLGALVHIVSANKKAQTLQSAITNLNFALETMSREMRVGSIYFCSDFIDDEIDVEAFATRPCALGNNKILAFKSSKLLPDGPSTTCQAIVAYKFEDTATGLPAILKAEQPTCHHMFTSADFAPLLSTTDVTITDISLSVSSETYQLAFIRVSGYAGAREREKSYFDVQTAVSPRLLQN